MTPMELTLGQKFEIERFSRAIDEMDCPIKLRETCKMLLQGWHAQKAATQWVLQQRMTSGPLVRPEDL